jgi:thiol:disulfide interchange protein DsbD
MLALLSLTLAGFSAQGAHTHAQLVLASETAKPGETVLAGVHLEMDEGWHTYWKNSGDSGMPTAIDWQLPPGVTAGQIQWPPPEKLQEKDFTTYIYKDDVVLLIPLKLAPNLAAGPLSLKAKVSWLECKVECIQGKANLEAQLNIANNTKSSTDAKTLAEGQKKLPLAGDTVSPHASWEKPPTGDLRPALLVWNSTKAATDADFFPDAANDFEVQSAVERVPTDAGKIAIRKQIKKVGTEWPKQISGLIIQNGGGERLAYAVKLPLESSGGVLAAEPNAISTRNASEPIAFPIWQMLLYAFIGGLILNIMPCVLPVIALKILGFVGQAKQDPGRARRLGLIYAFGVLVSFCALAALVLGLKVAGHKAGWGIQFGNPYFLVAMTILTTLIALNLFGVFEVSLGGRTMDAAAGLSSKHGAAGAFFNGLLATLLATSCTAPFLGAAVGFALAPTQSPLVTILLFLTMGIGLAFPYVLLTWQPAWLRFLPKPGAWMERFKVAMGFPMLAAGVWLFSLVSLHYGERSWWLIIFLVMVGVAAWIYGEFVQRNRARPVVAALAILFILGIGYFSVLEGHLRWRDPVEQAGSESVVRNDPNGISWQPWSPNALAQARAERRPVVVDFTAKWCLTCNTIVKPALESSSVRKKLQELNAVPLLGDYTAFPDNITEELNRFGRAGVPLVLVYPPNPNQPPIVLPEALTSSTIVSALDRAVQQQAKSN